MTPGTLALAMTGASGSPYGLRLLERLLAAGETVELMVSSPGRMVIATESGLNLPARPADMRAMLAERYGARPEQLRVYGKEDWFAPLASGSSAPRALVVCPCSSGTLAAIAGGYSRTLIERAADVVLKERRDLLLVPREMPFSVIHLENMLKLARIGAVIMPANPGFYHQPRGIDDLVDFVVARILDHLGVAHDLVPRWGERRTGENGETPP